MNFMAEEFFKKINASDFNRFIIDFEGIVFMSRCFTHEYLFQKLKSDKEIIEVNESEHVRKMFDVVSKDFI